MRDSTLYRWIVRLSSIVLLLINAGGNLDASPASSVLFAANDIVQQPPEIRPYLRYFSLFNIPETHRVEFVKVLLFHVNSLSREAEFGSLVKVSDDLYRVNVKDFAWDAATFEKLAQVDPYFHLVISEEVEEKKVVKERWAGGDWDGKYYPPGDYDVERVNKVKKKKVAQAPWLPTKEIATLVEQTQSQVPIVRADWFIHQTAIQLDRAAGYYDFLGLGTKQKDFQDLIGADVDRAKKVKVEVAAILARSGVTLQNRSISRFGAITGGYWITSDFKKSVDRSNVLRFLDKDLDPPQGDASEQYGFLPNGLFAFWLQNGQGERQDTAPDFIASDGSATGTDRRVHVGLSCIRCHVEGIRPIDDYARRLYRGALALATPDYDQYKRLRQLYLSDLKRWVKRDTDDYASALLKLTGLKTSELAKAYGKVWDDYFEVDLLVKDIARETGHKEEHLLASLKAYASKTPPLDPVLASLIAEDPLPIRREHLEETFGLLMTITRGYVPATPPNQEKVSK